jgi:hypothetical protein
MVGGFRWFVKELGLGFFIFFLFFSQVEREGQEKKINLCAAGVPPLEHASPHAKAKARARQRRTNKTVLSVSTGKHSQSKS